MRTFTLRMEVDPETYGPVNVLFCDDVRVGATYNPEKLQDIKGTKGKFALEAELLSFYDTVKNLVKDLTPDEARSIVRLVENK